MKIYEFTTWCANDEMFTVTEIEVEEKPKTYSGIQNHTRINKDEINKLQHHFGNRMYRLDNNPQAYIEAMIERRKLAVERATEELKRKTEDYNKWLTLKKG